MQKTSRFLCIQLKKGFHLTPAGVSCEPSDPSRLQAPLRHKHAELHVITHFPQSLRMLLLFFRFSCETGECSPESTPDDEGEGSRALGSSVLSAFPVKINRREIQKKELCIHHNVLFIHLYLHVMLWNDYEAS